MRVFYQGAYSNIAIDKAFKENKLNPQDTSFTSALFYGVLETAIQLDYIIAQYNKKKMDKEIQMILRIGFYQLLYMNSVPDNAAVNESVNLCFYVKKASAKGFINAILRSFVRDGKKLNIPLNPKKPMEYYSIQYACPTWLLELWSEQYGMETAVALAKASLQRPPLSVRVNTLKTTADKLIVYLKNRGVDAKKHPSIDNCLLIENSGSIDQLPQYKQGLFYVQDVASQLCVQALGAIKGETVLDICAAPGSKSFTIAQMMENEGDLYSFDLFDHKLALIHSGAKRLGITIMKTMLQDGSVYNETIPMADRVLCDVPCSGLGIIRRKPEIKYKKPNELSELPIIQSAILKNASRYVKDGGRLIYSTCTLNRLENEMVVEKFLSENNLFKPLQLSQILDKIKGNDDFFTTLFPHENDCDGFFIAVLEKQG